MSTEPDARDLDLRHELLRATERAVGAEAQAQRLQAELATSGERVRVLTAERKALARRLATVEATATWRARRLLVTAARRPLKRLAGRRHR